MYITSNKGDLSLKNFIYNLVRMKKLLNILQCIFGSTKYQNNFLYKSGFELIATSIQKGETIEKK